MRFLKEFSRGVFVIPFSLACVVVLSYIINLQNSFDPFTLGIFNKYGVEPRDMNTYRQIVTQYQDLLNNYLDPSKYFIIWLVLNIPPYAIFLTGIVVGLIGGKKWYVYCLVVTLLILLFSDNMNSVVWPHSEGMGGILETIDEENAVRWRHFVELLYFLPWALVLSFSGSFLGRLMFKTIQKTVTFILNV